jgi:membrane fusion protein (multidrug efflux system)
MLQFRDVTVDPTTGSYTLRMVFPNPNQVLLPGMFVRAIIEEGVNEQALLIPQQGVSRDPKGNPIALIVGKDNKVELRTLVLTRAMGDKWLVEKGLEPGEQVIVEGSLTIRPGASVRPVPFKASAGNVPQSGQRQPTAQAK